MLSNDAEHLVTILNGERYYDGKRLSPSTMLWKCTTIDCNTPPKPQRRGQYKDKMICNACSNRIKNKNPELLKKRGKAISKSIAELGNKWSEVATKNMSSVIVREKISNSTKKYIQQNKEIAIAIRKETAINNNKKTGFGTAEFSKRVWENLEPEERQARTFKAAKGGLDTGRKEHLDLVNSRFPAFKVLEFGNPDNLYECSEGHSFLMRGSNFLKRGICTECTPKSKLELDMHKWLETLLPNIKRNKRVLYLDDTQNGNKALEIDSFDLNSKFGVETHGVYYHREEFVGNVHKIKADLADKLGYTLLQFFEDEINYKQDIVKSVIKSKLGIPQNTIYGRDCSIVILKHKETKQFLNDNHLQGTCKSFLKVGLTYKNEIVSVLTFRKPRNKGENVVELARYCTKLDNKVLGGFSKMLKKAESILKTMGYNKLCSYSDRRYSKGEIYKNNGFEFKHNTVADLFWADRNGFRHPREISWSKTPKEMSKYWKILGAGHSYWEKNL